MVCWFNTEERKLRELYPTASADAVRDALPRHSWAAISVRAQKLGLKRGRIKVESVERPPLIQQLRDKRIALGMSQDSLAALIGAERTSMVNLEGRRHNPSLKTLMAWADALGFEVALVPKINGAAVTDGRESLPPPLMNQISDDAPDAGQEAPV